MTLESFPRPLRYPSASPDPPAARESQSETQVPDRGMGAILGPAGHDYHLPHSATALSLSRGPFG